MAGGVRSWKIFDLREVCCGIGVFTSLRGAGDDGQHHVLGLGSMHPLILFRWMLLSLVTFLCFAWGTLRADNDVYQGAAWQHCGAAVVNFNACFSGSPNTAYCQQEGANLWFRVYKKYNGVYNGQVGSSGACGTIITHGWESGNDCASVGDQGGYYESTSASWTDLPLGGYPGVGCSGGCEMIGAGPVGDCTAIDDDGNGVVDGVDRMWCILNYSASGEFCSSSSIPDFGPQVAAVPSTSEPAGGSFDCTNTQCVVSGGDDGSAPSNPIDQSGIGPFEPSEPVDTDSSGGSHGVGDGDSTTPIPGSTGGGAGQTAGDCNPLSNPDCGYTGSAGSRGSCDEVPPCDGDPVQCAILRQEWSHMCYGQVTELTLSTDCSVAPTCTGDPVGCAQIQYQFQAACSLHDAGGDLVGETEIWNDQALISGNPFNSENQQVVDVESALDFGGFLGGGSCPFDDYQVDFGPLGDMSIPFSSFCVFLPILAVGFALAGGIHSAYILKDIL
jgi:hypothetical protein